MRSGVLSERPVTTMTSFPAVRSNSPPSADTCCADATAGSMTRAPKVGRRLILKLGRSLDALTMHSPLTLRVLDMRYHIVTSSFELGMAYSARPDADLTRVASRAVGGRWVPDCPRASLMRTHPKIGRAHIGTQVTNEHLVS